MDDARRRRFLQFVEEHYATWATIYRTARLRSHRPRAAAKAQAQALNQSSPPSAGFFMPARK